MKLLQIYYMDHGVYGATFMVASSFEEAYEIYKTNAASLNQMNFKNFEESVQVFEIKQGVIIENLGDR